MYARLELEAVAQLERLRQLSYLVRGGATATAHPHLTRHVAEVLQERLGVCVGGELPDLLLRRHQLAQQLDLGGILTPSLRLTSLRRTSLRLAVRLRRERASLAAEEAALHAAPSPCAAHPCIAARLRAARRGRRLACLAQLALGSLLHHGPLLLRGHALVDHLHLGAQPLGHPAERVPRAVGRRALSRSVRVERSLRLCAVEEALLHPRCRHLRGRVQHRSLLLQLDDARRLAS